jgi:hypothetical protein
MILKIKFQENYIMHSGGLHVKPLSFIMNFTPLQRIIFHETSSYGRLCHENKGVDTPEMFFSRRQTQNAFDSNVLRHLLPTLNAGILIAYDEFWNYFKHPEAINAQQVVFNNSRNAGAWIDFIKNKSFDYIEKELYGNFSIQKNKHIIIIFIGRLQLDKSGKYIESFIHMINEIAKNVKNKLPIFIKPHIFSDLEFIEKCISKGVGDYNMKYIFTKLHPSVLASRATISFFIGDSNVIYEISNLNVPIVQCLYGFNDKEVAVKSSKKSDYIITKANPFLNDIISRIAFSKHTPVLYKKRRKELNCSFL